MEGFSYEIVKNPRIFKMNTLPAHSDHITYEKKFKWTLEIFLCKIV